MAAPTAALSPRTRAAREMMTDGSFCSDVCVRVGAQGEAMALHRVQVRPKGCRACLGPLLCALPCAWRAAASCASTRIQTNAYNGSVRVEGAASGRTVLHRVAQLDEVPTSCRAWRLC